MALRIVNDYSARLTQSVSATDTTLRVNAFPVPNPFANINFRAGDKAVLALWDGTNTEYVYVTDFNTNQLTLTVERGQEGPAYAFVQGNQLLSIITQGVLDDVLTNVGSAALRTAIQQYITDNPTTFVSLASDQEFTQRVATEAASPAQVLGALDNVFGQAQSFGNAVHSITLEANTTNGTIDLPTNVISFPYNNVNRYLGFKYVVVPDNVAAVDPTLEIITAQLQNEIELAHWRGGTGIIDGSLYQATDSFNIRLRYTNTTNTQLTARFYINDMVMYQRGVNFQKFNDNVKIQTNSNSTLETVVDYLRQSFANEQASSRIGQDYLKRTLGKEIADTSTLRSLEQMISVTTVDENNWTKFGNSSEDENQRTNYDLIGAVNFDNTTPMATGLLTGYTPHATDAPLGSWGTYTRGSDGYLDSVSFNTNQTDRTRDLMFKFRVKTSTTLVNILHSDSTAYIYTRNGIIYFNGDQEIGSVNGGELSVQILTTGTTLNFKTVFAGVEQTFATSLTITDHVMSSFTLRNVQDITVCKYRNGKAEADFVNFVASENKVTDQIRQFCGAAIWQNKVGTELFAYNRATGDNEKIFPLDDLIDARPQLEYVNFWGNTAFLGANTYLTLPIDPLRNGRSGHISTVGGIDADATTFQINYTGDVNFFGETLPTPENPIELQIAPQQISLDTSQFETVLVTNWDQATRTVTVIRAKDRRIYQWNSQHNRAEVVESRAYGQFTPVQVVGRYRTTDFPFISVAQTIPHEQNTPDRGHIIDTSVYDSDQLYTWEESNIGTRFEYLPAPASGGPVLVNSREGIWIRTQQNTINWIRGVRFAAFQAPVNLTRQLYVDLPIEGQGTQSDHLRLRVGTTNPYQFFWQAFKDLAAPNTNSQTVSATGDGLVIPLLAKTTPPTSAGNVVLDRNFRTDPEGFINFRAAGTGVTSIEVAVRTTHHFADVDSSVPNLVTDSRAENIEIVLGNPNNIPLRAFGSNAVLTSSSNGAALAGQAIPISMDLVVKSSNSAGARIAGTFQIVNFNKVGMTFEQLADRLGPPGPAGPRGPQGPSGSDTLPTTSPGDWGKFFQVAEDLSVILSTDPAITNITLTGGNNLTVTRANQAAINIPLPVSDNTEFTNATWDNDNRLLRLIRRSGTNPVELNIPGGGGSNIPANQLLPSTGGAAGRYVVDVFSNGQITPQWRDRIIHWNGNAGTNTGFQRGDLIRYPDTGANQQIYLALSAIAPNTAFSSLAQNAVVQLTGRGVDSIAFDTATRVLTITRDDGTTDTVTIPGGSGGGTTFTIPAGQPIELTASNNLVFHEDDITLEVATVNSRDSLQIKNGGVGTAKLADGAVTTGKIGADAIDGTKIADNAVSSEHIQSRAITSDKIDNNAVRTDEIQDGAVTSAKIASGVIPTSLAPSNNSVGKAAFKFSAGTNEGNGRVPILTSSDELTTVDASSFISAGDGISIGIGNSISIDSATRLAIAANTQKLTAATGDVINATLAGRTITLTRRNGTTFTLTIPDEDNWKGNFAQNTLYNQGDLVLFNSRVYIAVNSVPANNVQNPNQGTNWLQISINMQAITNVSINGTTMTMTRADGTTFNQTISSGGGGVTTFVALNDTPSSFSGQGGKVVKVNTGETALVFEDEAAGDHITISSAESSWGSNLNNFEPSTGALRAYEVLTTNAASDNFPDTQTGGILYVGRFDVAGVNAYFQLFQNQNGLWNRAKPAGGSYAAWAKASNVQADWNASSGDAAILNKPTIPAAQVNADWDANSGVAQILNKPTIPAAQVQSDWDQSNPLTPSFIRNKPTTFEPNDNSVTQTKLDIVSGVTPTTGQVVTYAANGEFSAANLPSGQGPVSEVELASGGDVDRVYPSTDGISWYSVGSGTFPTNVTAGLVKSTRLGNRIDQFLEALAGSNSNKLYMRTSTNAGTNWGAWNEVSGGGAALPAWLANFPLPPTS